MQRRNFLTFAAGFAGALALAGAALADAAQSKAVVDAAKAQGVVGEQQDGYLGFVHGSSDASVNAAVNEINAGRAQAYRDVAARNNVTPEAAGASAYKQVVQSRLRPGDYYQTAAGAWARK